MFLNVVCRILVIEVPVFGIEIVIARSVGEIRRSRDDGKEYLSRLRGKQI